MSHFQIEETKKHKTHFSCCFFIPPLQNTVYLLILKKEQESHLLFNIATNEKYCSSTADSFCETSASQLPLVYSGVEGFISKHHNDISVDMWIRMEQMTAALA